MKKFEYTILKVREKGFWSAEVDKDELNLHLNNMGALGWELVSSVETNGYEGHTKEIILFFKREQLN